MGPYYLPAGGVKDEAAGQVNWSNSTVHVKDMPFDVAKVSNMYFTTIIVASDYMGSGKDLVLGVVRWGYSKDKAEGSNVTGPTHDMDNFDFGETLDGWEQDLIQEYTPYEKFEFFH